MGLFCVRLARKNQFNHLGSCFVFLEGFSPRNQNGSQIFVIQCPLWEAWWLKGDYNYEGTSQIHVRIATGAILAGMAVDGNFRKYLYSLKAEIPTPSTFLLEQERILEESIRELRGIQDDTRKETVAENLMIQMCRNISSLLYEKSIPKISDLNTKEVWLKDCRAYVIDSTAIAQSCLYRIQNFG